MFSLLSCESGWAALCTSMSWASRSAQAMPAGPPPTITTSADIWGRSIPSIGLRKISIGFEFQVSNFECPDEPTGFPVRSRPVLRNPIDSMTPFNSPRTFKQRASKLETRNLKLPSCLRLLHFLNQRRNDVEQVAHDRIICDFEDGRF